MNVNIESHKDEVEKAMSFALTRALIKCGFVGEGYAKKLCPVDTGNLRNSITHTTDDKSAYIGTNVEYAPYVELGTSRMKARPYLRPAVENHKSTYQSIFKNELGK